MRRHEIPEPSVFDLHRAFSTLCAVTDTQSIVIEHRFRCPSGLPGARFWLLSNCRTHWNRDHRIQMMVPTPAKRAEPRRPSNRSRRAPITRNRTPPPGHALRSSIPDTLFAYLLNDIYWSAITPWNLGCRWFSTHNICNVNSVNKRMRFVD